MRVGRTCGADEVVIQIERLVAERGAPKNLRMDNGPELVAWALTDWCRMSGTGTSYIDPGSPWQNSYIESFNGRCRDELLNTEEFGTLIESQVVVEPGDWSTTRIGPTRPWEISSPQSFTPSGPVNINRRSRNEWTTNRGPVSLIGHDRVQEGRSSQFDGWVGVGTEGRRPRPGHGGHEQSEVAYASYIKTV